MPLEGQDDRAPGRITGRVVDASSGTPLPGAEVLITGGERAVTAGLDGRYTLSDLPPNTLTLVVRLIGYAPKTVTNVRVTAGSTAILDVALTPQVIELDAVEVVSAQAERGTTLRALDEQRHANTVMNAITAEQIRRSPDGDAGQAMQRVSGVTVKEGKYVLVRGLGERYTVVALNGARIPSAEPEQRVVPLDLFPAGLLEQVSTTKTFTPDQPGDFTGAQVNLRTREFLSGDRLSVSASMGTNTAATGQTIVRAPRVGSEWLGFAGAERQMPAALDGVGTLQGLSIEAQNGLIQSFRNVWTPDRAPGEPNRSFGVAFGGEAEPLGAATSYAASFSYAFGQEIRADEFRSIAVPSTIEGQVDEQNAQRGMTGRTSVLWGGLLNTITRIGANSKISVNATYTRSADNEATQIAGHNEGFDQYFDIARLTFVERAVRSLQVRGTHLIARGSVLDWSVNRSGVTRQEPDRSDLVYTTDLDPETLASRPVAWFGSARSATRTFSYVAEHASELGANYRVPLGGGSIAPALKAGVAARWLARDADSLAYDILNASLTTEERRHPAESLFNGAFAERDPFLLFANANGGRYTASERLGAAYLQLELAVSARLDLIGGARLEHWHVEVVTQTIAQGDTASVLDNLDVLPSLSARLRLGDRHVLRAAVSQTLARPEYRELSPVTYFDVLGGERLFGNPDLERGLIQNLDVRWEWYPQPGEVVSLGVFAKRFDDPIERVLVQTSDGNSPDATFVNADWARNFGVEVEVRTHLGHAIPALRPVGVFANATLMRSRIRPGGDGFASLTNAERPMMGQAPYVLNGGITFADASGALSGTLLYNVVGRRIHAAGIYPLPDSYEETRHLLDASLQVPLVSGLRVRFDAKNLLDAKHRITQGTVDRLRYRSGRSYSAGVFWTF